MKKLYEIPNTDTAYTVEELIGMVIAGAMVMKENEELKHLVAEVSLKNRVLKKSLNGVE